MPLGTDSETNGEARARSMCEIDLRASGVPEWQIAAAVDRFWPVLIWEMAGALPASENFDTGDRTRFNANREEFRRLTGR